MTLGARREFGGGLGWAGGASGVNTHDGGL